MHDAGGGHGQAGSRLGRSTTLDRLALEPGYQ